jgi:hypothetical protein
MRIIFVLIFYVITTVHSQAEVLSKHVTGRAINTGVAQELLTKRATANALENFLLQNGAKIKAITIVEDGAIAFDQIRINSEHRLLGFDLVQQQTSKDYTEVKLNVYYGTIDPSDECRDRQEIDMLLAGVTVNLSPHAPAYLVNIKKYLLEGLADITAKLDFVKLERDSTSVSNTEFAFDYATLAAAQIIKDEINAKETLTINVKVKQVNSADHVSVNFYTSSSNKKIETETGVVTTNAEISMLAAPLFTQNVPRPRNEVIADLLTPYLIHLSKVFKRISCEPVSTTLRKEGNQYRVEIGAQDGVNKNSVFLFEDGQTSGFGVKTLSKHQTYLIPLQSIFPVEPTDGALLYVIK